MKIIRKKRMDHNGDKLIFLKASGKTINIKPGPCSTTLSILFDWDLAI